MTEGETGDGEGVLATVPMNELSFFKVEAPTKPVPFASPLGMRISWAYFS